MPLGGSIDPKAGPTFLVVGDAAGSANPFDGEGIGLAYETGRLAAEVLHDAIDSGDAASLQRYPKLLAERSGDYQRAARLFAKVVGRPALARELSRATMRSRAALGGDAADRPRPAPSGPAGRPRARVPGARHRSEADAGHLRAPRAPRARGARRARRRSRSARRYPAVPVGTTKRDRQRANRQARLEELARQARRTKTKRRGLRIAILVVGALVLLFGLSRLVGGDDDDETGTPTDTIAPVTTLRSDADDARPREHDHARPGEHDVRRVDHHGRDRPPPCRSRSPTARARARRPTGRRRRRRPSPRHRSGASTTAATYTAEVVTNRGEFTITLDPEQAPGNVNNFVVLSRYHYYDGTGCHRVIKDFALQCGRPGEDESAPGYTVPDELPTEGGYEEGMVVMANTGSPDSGGGQWFVVIGPDGEALPPQYSIIGRVTDGYDSTVRSAREPRRRAGEQRRPAAPADRHRVGDDHRELTITDTGDHPS